jgi:hypothetical protein
MNAIVLRSAVELHLYELCRRLPEDLVRLEKVAVLALQSLEPFALLSASPGPLASVSLGLRDSTTHCLRRASDLAGNRDDRRSLRRVLAAVFYHHPNGSLTHR